MHSDKVPISKLFRYDLSMSKISQGIILRLVVVYITLTRCALYLPVELVGYHTEILYPPHQLNITKQCSLKICVIPLSIIFQPNQFNPIEIF